MPPPVDPSARQRPDRRVSRRAALRLWAALVGAAGLSPTRSHAQEGPLGPEPPPRGASLSVNGELYRLRAQFDPTDGVYAVTRLRAADLDWVPEDAPRLGALWIDGVSVDGRPAQTIDGGGGLEQISALREAIVLLHSETGLQVSLEYVPVGPNAIVHRLSLSNARATGVIRVASAATLSLPLWAGDLTEVLGVDDGPHAWDVLTRELPVTYGHHGLRSGDSGVYPLVRLATHDGRGIIAAVNSATAWRIEAAIAGDLRTLRAGEYRSDLVLRPGEQAELPEVVTIFYREGLIGAVAALRQYLDAVSPAPPVGWRWTPPVVFNTWFAFGCALLDDGNRENGPRRAARAAADSGVEVFVVDAGWYAGNPRPEGSFRRQRGKNREDEESHEDRKPDEGEHSLLLQGIPDDFNIALGTWVDNPDKWRAQPGNGSPHGGLRNFSDYVRGLDVRRPDGRSSGKMRFGLWFEPERFDPDFDHPDRVPSHWAIPGTPILDFSRPDVVAGIGGRLQYAIDAYGVDYLKVDSNYGYWPEATGGPTGHFWSAWSAGFARLLDNLRRANPSLYVEHCAGGLKRYWLDLARVAHATWLDDDVQVDNVRRLLDATDVILLPRQKTVLVTEDYAERTAAEEPAPSIRPADELLREYWGGDQRNGGTIGFSGRLDRWSADRRRLAAEALAVWKRDVRSTLGGVPG